MAERSLTACTALANQTANDKLPHTHQTINPRQEHVQTSHSTLRDRLDEQRVELGRVKLVRDRARNIDAVVHAWREARAADEGLCDGLVESDRGFGEVDRLERAQRAQYQDRLGTSVDFLDLVYKGPGGNAHLCCVCV
jgi:hypothetical protein